MKQINYELKNTSARTQYYKISKSDMNWLTTELSRYLALCGELGKINDPAIVDILQKFWRDKNPDLPKSKTGHNSPESFVSGLLNNILYGSQYDLSDIQVKTIENISIAMEVVYQQFNGLSYQSNCLPFMRIQFTQSLFSIR